MHPMICYPEFISFWWELYYAPDIQKEAPGDETGARFNRNPEAFWEFE